LDTDEAVQRFADLAVPLLADWCIVTVIDPDGTPRDVGRAHKAPALVGAMHRYADLRVATNNVTAPVPRMLRDPRPVVFPELTEEIVLSMVPDAAGREAAAPLRAP